MFLENVRTLRTDIDIDIEALDKNWIEERRVYDERFSHGIYQ